MCPTAVGATLRRLVFSGLAGGLAWLVILGPQVPHAQSEDAGAAPSDSAQVIDMDLLLEQLADTIPSPPEDGICGARPLTPFDLPARPHAPALGVVLSDGHAARWDPLSSYLGQLYWPMEMACSALGASLIWDPESFRGRLLIDTLNLGFVVGGEVIHCADSALQMSAPVLYIDNRLLLPVEALALIVPPFLSDRFTYQRDPHRLIQKPTLPVIEGLGIEDEAGRTVLRWHLPARPQARLLTDGVHALVVELPGMQVDPLHPPRPAAGVQACLYAIEQSREGARFTFHVAPSVLGWRSLWRAERREFHVSLTSQAEDLTEWAAFDRWPAVPRPPANPSRVQVVMVLPHASAEDWKGGPEVDVDGVFDLVCALGRRVGDELEDVGFDVTYVDDPGRQAWPGGWAAQANAEGGGVCVSLQPNICGDSLAAGYRIVSAAAGPGERPLVPVERLAEQMTRTAAERDPWEGRLGRLMPMGLRAWSAVAAEHSAASARLAWELELHLRAAQIAAQGVVPIQPVVRQRWPGSALEGLDMPGVILYLGRMGLGPASPSDADWAAVDGIAAGIARALEAFAGNEGEGE